jgi:hypothetical protein
VSADASSLKIAKTTVCFDMSPSYLLRRARWPRPVSHLFHGPSIGGIQTHPNRVIRGGSIAHRLAGVV